MKLSWCTLMVDDLERSLTFYEGVLGLKVHRRFSPGPNVEIAFVGDEGEAEIELIANKVLVKKLQELPERGAGVNLGLVVPSLDEAMKALAEQGIAIDKGPVQPNPHIKFLFIKDPNGYTIQLAQNC